MADVTVLSAVTGVTDHRGQISDVVWVSETTGYVISHDGSTFVALKTTDRGHSWSEVDAAGAPAADPRSQGYAIEAKLDTPNDADKIHVCYIDATVDEAQRVVFDVGSETWGSITGMATGWPVGTVNGSSAVSAGDAAANEDGDVLFAYRTQESGFPRRVEATLFDRSAATNTVVGGEATDPWGGGASFDQLVMCAINGGADFLCALIDESGNRFRVTGYDVSGDAWSSQTQIFSTVMSGQGIRGRSLWSIEFDHVNDRAILISNSNRGVAGNDINCWTITWDGNAANTPSVTGQGDVVTDDATTGVLELVLDFVNEEVYAVYCRGTLGSSVDVYWKKSALGTISWGSEVGAYAATADDYRMLAGCVIPAAVGGRVQPVVFDDDDLLLLVNDANDVEIAANTTHELAASISGAGSATADLTVETTHELAAAVSGAGTVTADLTVSETHELAASVSGVGSVAANLELVLGPAVAGQVPAPLAIVHVHDGAFRRIGRFVTAFDVARSYELGGPGLGSLEVALNDPLIDESEPLRGRVLVIESSLYPYPWVGAIQRRLVNRDRGSVSLQAKGFGGILEDRVLPTDYETSLNAGDEIRRALETTNRRNNTGIAMGAVANHGRLASGLKFSQTKAATALDRIADAGGVEWWLEFFASPSNISAVMRVARSRGADRFRVGPVLRDGFNVEWTESIEDALANLFALTVIAGQVSLTQSFTERTRHTVVRQEGGGFVTQLVPVGPATSSDTVGTDGRRRRDSAISAHGFARFSEVITQSPVTRREVAVLRDELRSEDITVQTADSIIDRIPVPERSLRLDSIQTADWRHITPGDVLRVDAPGAFIRGWDGPVRILGVQPDEDDGRMALVVELLREID